ncbi:MULTISPECIES: Rrf2 family transcriptional regulator [unclassified Oceanispirochaeta]|uniref:RrF2 family transcriptional regulator n=1 Tax=unclassified Oceanispirochaeta TaxID=2635722 RepID=UPI000E097239|nr:MULTISPECIES: Rrf2 family transcriptional regulator [unclassified Oceanispirochaeta]MBF9018122.1 Rrf2 family transcriptional regulator [Oceanispirochaeta sp. M2]NPD74586.1 Rrf2 family transcriptional regulator [Oceanispirochaeta sp. M1]RDG29538.1 Rrf2 family transcriptional regulator [Oceanispirochaeta sp. M1]
MNHLINISEAASLGFHGLALIAREAPDRLNVRVVAKELNASEAHLAKVFQSLSKAGLVSSQRGPAGGFVLSKAAEDVSFLEVYEILESPVHLTDCPMGYSQCGFHACIFEQKLNNINREILKTFEDIKLSDFTTTVVNNGDQPRKDR